MRICLDSSSFYPATFYGGPISACWDLSKKLVEKGNEIYVSTTNANGTKRSRCVSNIAAAVNSYWSIFIKQMKFDSHKLLFLGCVCCFLCLGICSSIPSFRLFI